MFGAVQEQKEAYQNTILEQTGTGTGAANSFDSETLNNKLKCFGIIKKAHNTTANWMESCHAKCLKAVESQVK